MQTVTEPLRDEHRHFSDPLDTIRQTAEGVSDLSLPELRRQMDDVHTFLVERFIPHARADEEAVSPLLERGLDAPPATLPVVRDLAEVSRLTAKLLALRERLVYSYFGPAQFQSLREVLRDLHVFIELHLAKEDEFCLTLLVRRIPAAESGFVA